MFLRQWCLCCQKQFGSYKELTTNYNMKWFSRYNRLDAFEPVQQVCTNDNGCQSRVFPIGNGSLARTQWSAKERSRQDNSGQPKRDPDPAQFKWPANLRSRSVIWKLARYGDFCTCQTWIFLASQIASQLNQLLLFWQVFKIRERLVGGTWCIHTSTC